MEYLDLEVLFYASAYVCVSFALGGVATLVGVLVGMSLEKRSYQMRQPLNWRRQWDGEIHGDTTSNRRNSSRNGSRGIRSCLPDFSRKRNRRPEFLSSRPRNEIIRSLP